MGFTQRSLAILAPMALVAGWTAANDGWAQQQQAGVAAAVRGRVEVAMTAGAVGREVKSGEAIYLGNAVKSGADSGLQILLLDQTTFTIGPNSELTIDQFIFDPNSGTGKVAASVAKGVFRFVTGKVAQTNPSNMTIRLPTGNIGIRGTIAMGSVDPGAGGQPPKQEVVLIGPGRGREGSARIGGLVLGANGGGGSVTIDQPGFGSQFQSNGSWGAPVRYTNEMINAIQIRLAPPIQGKGPGAAAQGAPAGGGPGGGGPGGPGAGPGGGPGGPLGPGGLGPHIDRLVADGSQPPCQQTSASSCSNLNPPPSMTASNGPSTFEQLRNVASGQFYYASSGTPLSLGGSYDIQINIDFGNRTIGGGNSRVDVNSLLVAGSLFFQTQSFASGSGAASFTQSGIIGLGGSICVPNCSTSITVTPQNNGGVAGATANHSIFITGNPSNSSGSGSASRQPGLAPPPG